MVRRFAMYIFEQERKTPVAGNFDVIVCGGGPAGVIAATAAARNGAKTLLIERYGFVGGMATAALVTPVSEFYKNGKRIIDGMPYELMERASRLGGADLTYESGNYPIDDEVFKLAAQQMLLESGVTLLYHSFFADCITNDGHISHVIVQNKAGRVAYGAKVFVDCTGDADVVRAAGYKVVKEETMQPATLWFQLSGVDTKALEAQGLFDDAVNDQLPISETIRNRLGELNRKGEMPLFGGPWISRGFNEGTVSINLLREATDASSPEQFTRTECSLREKLFRVVEIMRENFPEFRNCRVLKSGTQTGVRETYHIVGMYQLTTDDVINPKPFPDTVAKGAHVIDIHKPDSIDQELMVLDQEYNIPYGIMVPYGSRNVIVAGRSVCADRAAFGTVRVMAVCMAIGQAAGTAAAIAAQKGLDMSKMDIPLLVKTLKEQGAVIDFDNCK